MIKKKFLKIAQLAFILSSINISVTVAQQNNFDKNNVTIFFENQQFEEAINYMKPYSLETNNTLILNYLGYAYYMNENETEAEKIFKSVLNIDSNNFTANQYLSILTKNTNPDIALLCNRRLITLQPTKATYYRNIGEIFKRKNNFDSSLAYLKTAYQLNPTDFKNIISYSSILIDKKMYSESDTIIQKAIEIDSMNVDLLKLWVRLAYNSENYEQTIVPGERLIALKETPISPLTQLVYSYYSLKQYTNCIKVCQYLIDNDLGIENILFYQAKAYAKINNFEKSNELLKKCLTLAISKDAEMYFYSLALNYEQTKQFKNAVSNYDTAFYLFKNPVMLYNNGRINEVELKNTRQAAVYYKRYLALAKPQQEDEKKAYQYVKEKWGQKK